MKKLYVFSVISMFSLFSVKGQVALNGNATDQGSGTYQLTAAVQNQKGSIWNTTPLDLSKDFHISAEINVGDRVANVNPGGADGIAFVLQKSGTTALGPDGGFMGYGNINPSLDVEFDTWQNTEALGSFNDPVEDHLAINKNGSLSHTGTDVLLAPVILGELEDGKWHPVVFDWKVSTSTFTVSIDGTTRSINYNISSIFGANSVYFGFTSATGLSYNNQFVRNIVNEPVCPPSSCSITAIPSDNTNTGGVPTNIYLGYGPQSVTLRANATGVSYSWTPIAGLTNATSNAPVFTPKSPGTYNFTVTVSNSNGCKTTCSIQICVVDIRVPGTDGKKVYVCHLPPGNPGNAQELSISINAVHAHVPLHGGDHLGKCDQVPCTPSGNRQMSSGIAAYAEVLDVTVMPNPSFSTFSLVIKSSDKEYLTVKVIDDVNARVLEVYNNVSPNTTLKVGDKLQKGSYHAEVIQGNNRTVVNLIKVK